METCPHCGTDTTDPVVAGAIHAMADDLGHRARRIAVYREYLPRLTASYSHPEYYGAILTALESELNGHVAWLEASAHGAPEAVDRWQAFRDDASTDGHRALIEEFEVREAAMWNWMARDLTEDDWQQVCRRIERVMHPLSFSG